MFINPKELKPISTVVDGYEVRAFGHIDVFSVSPTYFPDLFIQVGNAHPVKKIHPKKSWEIVDHVIGMTPRRMPSAAIRGVQLYHNTYFIDGDWNTVGFAGTYQHGPDTQSQAWLRIQLPITSRIQSVKLVSAKGALAFPVHFEIRVCQWHIFSHTRQWKTVYQAEDSTEYEPGMYDWPARPRFNYDTIKPDTPIRIDLTWSEGGHGEEVEVRECAFEPTEAREVWILSPQDFLSAEVEVIDESGQNIALLSRGATASVSRPIQTFWVDARTHADTWSLNYDMGVKWVKVNFWLEPLNWQFVEREKGRYEIDPFTDAAITEAVECGVNIVMCLGGLYGLPNHPDYPVEVERIEGFCNYVRFMVEHFKNRVQYYEIFNEYYEQHTYSPDSGPYELAAAEYAKYAVPAAKAIKAVYPEAKVVLVGPDPLAWDFIEASLNAGLAGLVDVISWHQYQWTMPPEVLDRPNYPWVGPEVKTYADAVRYVQRAANAYGVHEFHNNEAGAYAFYWGEERPSTLVSAKYLARTMVLHATLKVPTFWNRTDSYFLQSGASSAGDTSLSEGAPKGSLQPAFSYYVCRTLCALMDSVKPMDLDFALVADREVDVEKHAFQCPDGDLLLAMWILDVGADDYPAVEATLSVAATAAEVVGYELLNGQEQPLDFTHAGETLEINRLLIRDYPLLIRLSKHKNSNSQQDDSPVSPLNLSS